MSSDEVQTWIFIMENSNATSIVDQYLSITITYSGFFITPHFMHFLIFIKHNLINVQLKLHYICVYIFIIHIDIDI